MIVTTNHRNDVHSHLNRNINCGTRCGTQKLNLSSHRQQLGGKHVMVLFFLVSNAILVFSLLILPYEYYFIMIVTSNHRDDAHSQS